MTPRPAPRLIPADADGLLRRISSHIDDGMLSEIAAADYGMDIDGHLAPLRRLRDEGLIPVPLVWEPKEVLELIRWSEPEDPAWRPGGQNERGHWMRAFACAALLRAGFEGENLGTTEGQNQTLAALIASLQKLNAGLDRAAAGLIVWLIERIGAETSDEEWPWYYEDAAFLGVGLLWFALHLDPPVADERLVELCSWVSDCEKAHNKRHIGDYGLQPGRWLLSTTFFNLNHAKWEALGRDLLDVDVSARSAEAQGWVRLIGALLSDNA